MLNHVQSPLVLDRSHIFWGLGLQLKGRGGTCGDAGETRCAVPGARQVSWLKPSALLQSIASTCARSARISRRSTEKFWRVSFGYGSIPMKIPFLGGWTSIYQLFRGSLGTRVLTHPHLYCSLCYSMSFQQISSPLHPLKRRNCSNWLSLVCLSSLSGDETNLETSWASCGGGGSWGLLQSDSSFSFTRQWATWANDIERWLGGCFIWDNVWQCGDNYG